MSNAEHDKCQQHIFTLSHSLLFSILDERKSNFYFRFDSVERLWVCQNGTGTWESSQWFVSILHWAMAWIILSHWVFMVFFRVAQDNVVASLIANRQGLCVGCKLMRGNEYLGLSSVDNLFGFSTRRCHNTIVRHIRSTSWTGQPIGTDVESTRRSTGIEQKVWPIVRFRMIQISLSISTFSCSICLITKHGISGVIIKKNKWSAFEHNIIPPPKSKSTNFTIFFQ